MTVKQATELNINPAADDVRDECLDTYCNVDNLATDSEVIAFALLYLCDKLDSIDTRLYRLLKEGENREKPRD
jgi:hypothetical protein